MKDKCYHRNCQIASAGACGKSAGQPRMPWAQPDSPPEPEKKVDVGSGPSVKAVGLGRALLSCHVASVAGFDF